MDKELTRAAVDPRFTWDLTRIFESDEAWERAFDAVKDGQINLTPNETAMKAARDAMNGWDPTGGALYYYNPAVATSSWIFDRQTVTVIGKHVFAI